MTEETYRIASFYEFRPLKLLERKRADLLEQMRRASVHGTLVLAEEGYNGMLAGTEAAVGEFLEAASTILGSRIRARFTRFDEIPFRRRKVKIKKEIVTLKKEVDIGLARGTHVGGREWNRIISEPDTFLIDARNYYEVKTGRFRNAADPGTSSFSELPEYVEQNMDPLENRRVAMYCTGGIRCEKFAAYLKKQGFEEVYQLKGGILGYLEEMPREESLWEGECFVFDERITVDSGLQKGKREDLSISKNKARGGSEPR